MDRPRSKRSYHYDHDSDSQTPPPPPRTKPRYDGGGGHRRVNHQRRSSDRRQPPPPPPPPPSGSSQYSKTPGSPPSDSVTTFFRILCSDAKIGGVFGKSGNLVKSIRQETGAWINVHDLVPGDDERIIETADSRRRESDGRPPHYSPAQEALLLIHEKVLDVDLEDGEQDEEEYDRDGGLWGGERSRERERGRVTTRLVVPRMHVGCLLGKAGKIIEHMRNETETHIRVLPRDQYTPRCISMSEEIVQVYGDGSCVKKAVEIISSRLKESLHRERGPFRGRIHSPEGHFIPNDDLISNSQHQSAFERADLGSRISIGHTRVRNSAYGSENNYLFDSDADAMIDRPQSFAIEDIVFRILCPSDKVESIVGSPNGIIEMLQTDVGVDVRVTDPVDGSNERVIVITSDEGPDDELFPAQEALLHVQTHIVDLGPDKDNIITTRLLVQTSEIECLEGKDWSLSDFQKLTCANVQVLPKEDLPLCALENDELIQIVGEIRAARKALVQITSKLRGYLYRDICTPEDAVPLPFPASNLVGKVGHESTSTRSLSREVYQGSDPPIASFESARASSTNWSSKPSKDAVLGPMEQEQNFINDSGRQSGLRRFSAPLVTKSTFEVVIPEDAVSSLITKSGSKLAQISEMSGATMTLLEDRPDCNDKVVQISGTPEQAERAQSLLQGFILSTL